jgi:sigma-B regulation protein RsbU (phosphoserine phosphatase)
MFRVKSLQLRFTLFMILPVAILQVVLGSSAFFYARDLLLSQWREASLLKLQRAAHQADMRLWTIKNWISMFHESSGAQYSESFHQWVLEQLARQEGVTDVNLTWSEMEKGSQATGKTAPSIDRNIHGMNGMGMGRMPRMQPFHSALIREITPPRFDASSEHGTVSLISELNDETGRTIGQLEVVVDFTFIFQHVVESGWWQSNKAFLVDKSGHILVCTQPGRHGRLADNDDLFELETLRALTSAQSGTLLSPGHPPEEVSGYYRLQEAPWSLVMIAPGREILAPIVQLRLIYFSVGIGSIVVIVALIRLVTLRTTSAIKKVSDAALKLSKGDFAADLPVLSQDEVGELTRSFNAMTAQLKERICMKEAMGLAMEVQQHFLPHGVPDIPGLDIAARSIYCDETGGDFYDFIENSSEGGARFGIVLGDGSGHGIAAALLMASVRAALRTRLAQPGSPAEVITDVNRLLCYDTEETGHFMTLFYVEVDLSQKTMRWVRAGHEPALLIDPANGSVEELKGEGMAVGTNANFVYRENTHGLLQKGQILYIGTDGVLETQNPSGERFGAERLTAIMQKSSWLSSSEIADQILAALANFRNTANQEDDVTLLVAKARG